MRNMISLAPKRSSSLSPTPLNKRCAEIRRRSNAFHTDCMTGQQLFRKAPSRPESVPRALMTRVCKPERMGYYVAIRSQIRSVSRAPHHKSLIGVPHPIDVILAQQSEYWSLMYPHVKAEVLSLSEPVTSLVAEFCYRTITFIIDVESNCSFRQSNITAIGMLVAPAHATVN